MPPMMPSAPPPPQQAAPSAKPIQGPPVAPVGPAANEALNDPMGPIMQSHERLTGLQTQQIDEQRAKRQQQAGAIGEFGQKNQAAMGQMMQNQQGASATLHEKYVPPDTRMDMSVWLAASAGIAMLLSGRGRNSQAIAMTAFAGSVDGFMKGKKDQQEEKYRAWKANQEQALTQTKLENEHLQMVLQSNKMDYDTKMAQLELQGTQTDDKILKELAYQKNITAIAEYADKRQQLTMKLEQSTLKLETAMVKWQQSQLVNQGKALGLNTEQGMLELQQEIMKRKASGDEKGAQQLIEMFKQMHPAGGSGGKLNEAFSDEKKAESGGGGGITGWLSSLFGGGGAKEGAKALPGSSAENPAPLPAGSMPMVGMYYSIQAGKYAGKVLKYNGPNNWEDPTHGK